MYQGMSVAHDQSGLPVAGSKPRTFPWIASTSSVVPPPVRTVIGVFHPSLIPGARQTSLPLFRFSATTLSLSMLALTISNSPTSTGDDAEPQPFSSDPTSACHSGLPEWSNAWTPDLPKNAYTRSDRKSVV